MKNPEYLVILGIIIVSAGVLMFLYTLQCENSGSVNNTEKGYLGLNNETMICNFTHICFYREEEWHSPAYGMNTNLIEAYESETENKKLIKNFFERDKIVIAVNTTPGVVDTTHFAHYLGYYLGYKGMEKEIIPTTPADYNSTKPALMIYGPDPTMKDSITFEGGNLVVRGNSRESIKFLLGKILLVIVE